MRLLGHLQHTGRKSRPGRICFDDSGKSCVFVNYCPDCRGKIVMSRPEAQAFSAAYRVEKRRLVNRCLDVFMRRKQLPELPNKDPHEELKQELMHELTRKLQLQAK